MSSFINFLGILVVVVASISTIALMLTGLWEIIKYLIKETRGIRNENSSHRTQKTKIKR